MSLYPESIARCQHIKVNGTQCGSPSLRETIFCYYHIRYHSQAMAPLEDKSDWYYQLPTLEDANSIQVTLADVIARMLGRETDHKTTALLLYALQTAAFNLRQTSFEPPPTRMVIDRQSVAKRPIGATAWSAVEGREYDELESGDSQKKDDARKGEVDPVVDTVKAEMGRYAVAELQRMIEGGERDPDFLDKPVSEAEMEERRKHNERLAALTGAGGQV